MKKFIVAILVIAMLLCASCLAEMRLAADFVTAESAGYVWIGNVNCSHAVIRVDYPEYGVVEGQNIRLELNDLPTIMMWHDADAVCAVFDLDYIDGEIVAHGACGGNPMVMDELVAGIKDTNHDGIMWAALAGNVIPKGTRIRIWGDAND